MTTYKEPKILIPEVKIKERIKELAEQINIDYQDKELILICALKGSFMFFSDLIRELDIPVTCEFLGVSSYGSQMSSSGEVKITLDINEPISGKHVLIVEDIVDSGLTLSFVMKTFETRRPASIRCCSLLIKPDALKVPVEVEYIGFNIEDQFVVGYGLDYAEKYRGLPFIGYLEKEGH